MSYSVIPTPRFKREAKKLLKKYTSLKGELSELTEILQANPEHGTSLGKRAYKIRLGVKSKRIGKSGRTRIITYVIAEDGEIYF